MGICDNFSLVAFPVVLDDSLGFRGTLDCIANSSVVGDLAEMLHRCEECEVWHLCQGGCLSQRLYLQRNVPLLYEDYCCYRKTMLTFMRGLLANADSCEHSRQQPNLVSYPAGRHSAVRCELPS